MEAGSQVLEVCALIRVRPIFLSASQLLHSFRESTGVVHVPVL